MVKFSLVKNSYSTTRLLKKLKPAFKHTQEHAFESILFLKGAESRRNEGGLRSKCYYKNNHSDMPLITVITVVFNGAEFLEKTIQSVINQTYSNVEYIIIDGGSTDGTLDIIKKYEHAVDYWVSEKDRGIYEAMNKALVLASGEWVNFMNCGDQFYADKTLDQIFIEEKFTNYEIIFGDHEVSYTSGRKRIAKAGNVEKLRKGSQFCHQASFIKTNYHKSHPFNPYNKISADFEFYYLAWKTKARFKYMPKVVSSISAGGVSDVRRIDSILGYWLVVNKDFSLNIFYIIVLTKEIFKGLIKKHFCWKSF